MSASTHQNRYKADLREWNFVLFEQFKLDEILGSAPFEAWGPEDVKSVINECYKFAREILGPYSASADQTGCRLENGEVKTPEGFKQAWDKTYEAGWKQVGVAEEYGGGGAPFTLDTIVEELYAGSNTAFGMYPGLAQGAADVIAHFGTDEQKATYCEKTFGGVWGGTMCLTEPQAGSDVGASTSKAVPLGDGAYSITGTKIFISGGDHDLTENIVHLVLARAPGAGAGTKGLTLFIVPKIRINADGSLGEPNDVAVGSIEHKMGINGSATCVLNFGENEACIGYPVGGDDKLHQGMRQMFKMMNGARILVGVQGIAVASTAYLNALEYAKERKQGSSISEWKNADAPRVPIIEHPDVRRMLLDMKSRVEGLRALAIKLTTHGDRARALSGKDDEAVAYHRGQVDLLVPLVKAYGSDQAFRVCETAIQTYGGAGYTRDYPVEQYCRDSKIFSIYEGTNHIQAMDLVGRKLGQGGGANTKNFLQDVGKFIAKHGAAEASSEAIAEAVKELAAGHEALTGSVTRLMTWQAKGRYDLISLAANRFLEMLSELTVAWLLLDGAVIATKKLAEGGKDDPDHAFYSGKVQAALFFARNVLPGVRFKAEQMNMEDSSPLDISDEAFAQG